MKQFLFMSSLFVLPAGSMAFLFKDKINEYFNKNKTVKDETRFNSVDYGLNWGSRTDEIVN
jgi:hypothetical protein